MNDTLSEIMVIVNDIGAGPGILNPCWILNPDDREVTCSSGKRVCLIPPTQLRHFSSKDLYNP